MNRAFATILSLAAAAIVGYGTLLGVVGALYGFMWIFVYGDGTWPAAAQAFAEVGLPLIGLAAAAIAAWLTFRNLRAALLRR